jgi:prolipoprotein diacylglyceryltransferase
LEEILDEYNITNKVENSLRKYNDWLLGICIGLGAIVISLIPKYKNTHCGSEVNFTTVSFTVILFFVFAGIIINGRIKYLHFNREIQMNTIFGKLKKIRILREAKTTFKRATNDKEDYENWTKEYEQYNKESDRIIKITKLTNIGTYITAINIILTGIYILIYVYFSLQ